MKLPLRWAAITAMALALTQSVAPQPPPQHRHPDDEGAQPPTAKQQEDILKADHAKDLKDAAQLIELAEQLKEELEKNDRHVLSLSSLKKTEEIEKLARRIHARLVR
jgi:hypothetical protein